MTTPDDALIVREYTKFSEADKEYGFDLSKWLATGETVSSVTWTDISETASGLTLHGGGHSTNTIYTWISGGTANPDGVPWVIEGKFVTSAPQTEVVRLLINVRE